MLIIFAIIFTLTWALVGRELGELLFAPRAKAKKTLEEASAFVYWIVYIRFAQYIGPVELSPDARLENALGHGLTAR